MPIKNKQTKQPTLLTLSVGPGGEFPGFRLQATVWTVPGVPISNKVKRNAFRLPLLKLLEDTYPDEPTNVGFRR